LVAVAIRDEILKTASVEARADRIEALAYDYDSREKEAVASCNLCGSNETVEVSRRDRYGFPAVLRLCVRCGLAFLSPRLTATEYTDFYRRTYRPLVSAYHGRTIDAETVQDDQRGYAAELVAFLRKSLPRPPETVLDMGGSTGVVASAVSAAFGSKATVLDPAPAELEVAARAGMETIAGFAEDFEPGGRIWDLVLLCQTIDHLLDVSATVSSLARMVARDGHAFVDVLDVLLIARREGSVEGAVKIDHPYYLTAATARAYFDQAGLEVAAERLSDDGHRGFVLRPTEPHEPDWEALALAGQKLLDEVKSLGAR
jgi:2-polyprenyl-3-methyl-5-hydroxy-6-metoxy-1,4-benzoquinol methylase